LEEAKATDKMISMIKITQVEKAIFCKRSRIS